MIPFSLVSLPQLSSSSSLKGEQNPSLSGHRRLNEQKTIEALKGHNRVKINVTKHSPEVVIQLNDKLSKMGKTGEEIVDAVGAKLKANIPECADKLTAIHRKLNSWHLLSLGKLASQSWGIIVVGWVTLWVAHIFFGAPSSALYVANILAILTWVVASISYFVSRQVKASNAVINPIRTAVDALQMWLNLSVEVDAKETAKNLMQTHLTTLAFAILRIEREKVDDQVKRACDLRDLMKDTMKLATFLGFSDGDRKPHFDQAERRWTNLTTK